MNELIKSAVEAVAEAAEEGVRESAKEEVVLAAQELQDMELRAVQDLEEQITPVIFDPREEADRAGGLSACSYKCITSYCYPVNLAKGINSSNPHRPNSSVGHT